MRGNIRPDIRRPAHRRIICSEARRDRRASLLFFLLCSLFRGVIRDGERFAGNDDFFVRRYDIYLDFGLFRRQLDSVANLAVIIEFVIEIDSEVSQPGQNAFPYFGRMFSYAGL